ncbi:MAG: hypothetical protein NT150_01880, partial [Bacteroidetes bacterium]|nr:hypothetical protein [Bacteroidota bacterium]
MSKKLVLIALVFLGGLVHAGVDVQSTSKLGAAIDNADITVEGNRYAYSSANASNRPYFTERAFAMVKLSCDQLYTGSYTGTASVNVVITYKVEENGVYVDKSATQVLKLESDNSKVIDAAYFKAEGAEQIHVVATVVGSFPAGWPQIKLEVSVSTESFSTLSLADITSMQLTHSAALNVDGNLEVQWSPAISNADHYELEWTYVSDQGEKPGDSLTYDKLDIDRFLFRNNSSRVEVSGLSYEIPLMYEKGLILYRLRGVGKRTVNGVVVQSKTEWTAPDAIYGTVQEFVTATAARNGGGAGNVFKFRGLEGNLNWQSSLSFAEEGKHKAVLAYHDGSMRNRQAVTRINTDKRAILGETLYDFNGRPVIQLLPVPVTSNTLNYRPNFNLIEGKNTLQKNDYSVITEGDGCAITSPLFSDTTGASEYYSPNNEFDTLGNIGKNIINRALIPDADKYPYTQTQYTSDNTGRIKAQSGVGEAHQLLSTHETKYLYGAPNQEELT